MRFFYVLPLFFLLSSFTANASCISKDGECEEPMDFSDHIPYGYDDNMAAVLFNIEHLRAKRIEDGSLLRSLLKGTSLKLLGGIQICQPLDAKSTNGKISFEKTNQQFHGNMTFASGKLDLASISIDDPYESSWKSYENLHHSLAAAAKSSSILGKLKVTKNELKYSCDSSHNSGLSSTQLIADGDQKFAVMYCQARRNNQDSQPIRRITAIPVTCKEQP